MKTYIGTKVIKATPMTKSQYNLQHQRNVAGDDIDGYLSYQLGILDAQGVLQEDGYFSWSPKDVFDAAYRVTTGVPFGLALEAMKAGRKANVAPMRAGEWWELGKTAGLDLHLGSGKVISNASLTNTEILSDSWTILD
jgi:hypothetical protein